MTLVCGSEAWGCYDYERLSRPSQEPVQVVYNKDVSFGPATPIGGVLASTEVRARGMHAERLRLVNPVENQRNCGHAACSRGLINRGRPPANAYGAGQDVI